LLWTAVGVVLFGVVLVVVRDHTVLANYSYTLLLLGLLFLAVPAVLPAQYSEVNGAQIWIKVPHLFSIQPGEFAKIALVVFAAAFLASKRAVLNSAGRQVFGMLLPRGRDLGPLLLALLLCLTVFVRARDLGQALLLFGVILVMIYLATSRVSWMIIGLIGFCGGAYLAYLMFAHVRVRVDIWLDPFADPQNTGYQLVQSLLGLGTGGITGTGLGAGHPDIVPFASTDFITAAVGEELGLVGVILLLRPSFHADQLIGGLFGLVTGILAGLAYYNVRELGELGEREERTVFYFTLFSTVASALWMALFEFHSVDLQGGLLLLGVGASATVAQLAMTRAYQRGKTLVSASLAYTTVIFASFFGMLLWHETLSLAAWLAIVLIVASGLIATRFSRANPAEQD